MISTTEYGSGISTLVFIHGNSSSKAVFNHQAKYFSQNYKVLTLDLPGHGQSVKPNAKNKYSTSFFADCILNVINEKQIKNFTLIGHSFGAHVALNITSQKPVGLQGVFLLNASPMETLEDLSTAFNQVEASNIIFKKNVSDNEILTLKEHFHIKNDEEDFFKTFKSTAPDFRESLFESIMSAPNLREKSTINSLEKPVTIVFSKNETLLNKSYISSLPSELTNADIIQTDIEGHFLQIENPQKFNSLLSDFLSKNNI